MALTATVTPGIVLTLNQEVDTADLNALANPVVTLSGTIDDSQFSNLFPTYVTGDVTGTQTLAIGNNRVTDTKLSSDASNDSARAVSTDHVKDEAITSSKLATGAVTAGKIGAGVVTETELATASVTAPKLNLIGATTETPVTGDFLYFSDTSDSDAVKKVSFGNLPIGVSKYICTKGSYELNPSGVRQEDDQEGYASYQIDSDDTITVLLAGGNEEFKDNLVNGNAISIMALTPTVLPTLNGIILNQPYIIRNKTVNGGVDLTFTLETLAGTPVTFLAAGFDETFTAVSLALPILAKGGSDNMFLVRISKRGEYGVVFETPFANVDDYAAMITCHGTKVYDWGYTKISAASTDLPTSYPPDNESSVNDGDGFQGQVIVWDKLRSGIFFRHVALSDPGTGVAGAPIDPEFLNVFIVESQTL